MQTTKGDNNMAVPMRKIHQARRMILSGHPVKHIALILKVSESTIRLYTKSERAKMKERGQII